MRSEKAKWTSLNGFRETTFCQAVNYILGDTQLIKALCALDFIFLQKPIYIYCFHN